MVNILRLLKDERQELQVPDFIAVDGAVERGAHFYPFRSVRWDSGDTMGAECNDVVDCLAGLRDEVRSSRLAKLPLRTHAMRS